MGEKVFYGKGIRRIKKEDSELYDSIENLDKNVNISNKIILFICNIISLFDVTVFCYKREVQGGTPCRVYHFAGVRQQSD